MDVTLLGNYSHDENESMTRYAEMLKTLLTAHGCRVEIIRPEPFFGRLRRSGHGLGKWLGYLDKYLLFPISLRRHVRRRKAGKDLAPEIFLVHVCDHSNAVYIRWLKDVSNLVTCHDLVAVQTARGTIPGLTTGWTGRLLQAWIFSGLRAANFVACDTRETRDDLLSLAPELESRSCTIELPLNYPYAPMPAVQAVAELAALEPGTGFRPGQDRFLFHVGGNQWYKNREGVIRIYAKLCSIYAESGQDQPPKLVMAGKPPSETMLRLVEEKSLGKYVLFFTSVSNQQLCAFYNLAEALVYPSLKEGFGWPIIEAQACGCPVVTSDRGPMNRLAGSAGLVADPEDEISFAAQIFEALDEKHEARQHRKQVSIRHAENFNPRAFSEQMVQIYREILRKNYS